MKSRFAIVVCFVLSWAVLAHAEDVTIKGKVVDAAGKPVSGVEVASFWKSQDDAMKSFHGVTSDEKGQFTLKASLSRQPLALLALDKDRTAGGLVTVDKKTPGADVSIVLGPLVRLKGDFFCKEMDFKPKWTNVYLMTPDGARFVQAPSEQAKFSFLLPAGEYKFWGLWNRHQERQTGRDP